MNYSEEDDMFEEDMKSIDAKLEQFYRDNPEMCVEILVDRIETDKHDTLYPW